MHITDRKYKEKLMRQVVKFIDLYVAIDETIDIENMALLFELWTKT